MKISTTADRLRQLMNERGLRQADILRLVAPYCALNDTILNKNHLSQYLSGKAVPRQDKLNVLSRALKVSEAWLMGYDVPKYEYKAYVDQDDADEKNVESLKDQETNAAGDSDDMLLDRVMSLTPQQKEKLTQFIDKKGW